MPGLCLQGVELVRFGSLDRARGGHLEGYLRKCSNGGSDFFVQSCLESRNTKQQLVWQKYREISHLCGSRLQQKGTAWQIGTTIPRIPLMWHQKAAFPPWPICDCIIPNDLKGTRSKISILLGHSLYLKLSLTNKTNLQVSISSDGRISAPLPTSPPVLYIKIRHSAALGYGMQIRTDSHRF